MLLRLTFYLNGRPFGSLCYSKTTGYPSKCPLTLTAAGVLVVEVEDNNVIYTDTFRIGFSDEPISTPLLIPALNTRVRGNL